MSTSHLIRLGTITGKSGILDAMKHNKRTLQAERGAHSNIDVNRMSLNYSLTDPATPEHIARHAKSQMVLAGIDKPRKNQVMAVEILFSLPINRHKQDTSPFFKACHDWVMTNFDGELLSFDVHLDEAAPHAHAVILPLVKGKMQGSKMIGNKANLMRLINLFHKDVACHYGLSRSDKKRLNHLDKATLTKDVLSGLKGDSVMNSAIWSVVRDMISQDPLRFSQILSIEPPQKVSAKHFIDIKRSKGHGSFIK
jgi:hypothetical protein